MRGRARGGVCAIDEGEAGRRRLENVEVGESVAG